MAARHARPAVTRPRAKSGGTATDEPLASRRDSFPFRDWLPYQAQLLARLVQNDYMTRIAATGVAPAQAYVLGELWTAEPLSQIELARRLDIGRATIGQTLDRLERNGVVERRQLAGDRRVAMVHLTSKGRALCEPLRRAAEQQIEMLHTQLGAEEVGRLTRLLANATRSLRRN